MSIHKLSIDEHTYLRALHPIDAAGIFQLIDNQRDYFIEWLPFVADMCSISDSQAAIAGMLYIPDASINPVFSIIHQETFAGMVGFKCTDIDNLRTEIGYWLSQDLQGKGIVTRSVAALCAYAFDTLSIHRIQIKCGVGNTPSNRVPQRLGFTHEGTERDGELLANGEYTDIHVYSLLSSDQELKGF